MFTRDFHLSECGISHVSHGCWWNGQRGWCCTLYRSLELVVTMIWCRFSPVYHFLCASTNTWIRSSYQVHELYSCFQGISNKHFMYLQHRSYMSSLSFKEVLFQKSGIYMVTTIAMNQGRSNVITSSSRCVPRAARIVLLKVIVIKMPTPSHPYPTCCL